jgi:mRNA-degrading endonuclease YafQ of YafQ-DinJ toxin-antitoxin module
MVHALDNPLRDDVYASVDQLKDEKNHPRLKVHKLHGKFKQFYGFSVNYKIRIVFEKLTPRKYLLHIVGGHEIYE